jgi:hypothetical protein
MADEEQQQQQAAKKQKLNEQSLQVYKAPTSMAESSLPFPTMRE